MKGSPGHIVKSKRNTRFTAECEAGGHPYKKEDSS